MIKNLNDILSLIIMIVIFVMSIRTFGYAFVKSNVELEDDVSKFELLKNYIDNEEE